MAAYLFNANSGLPIPRLSPREHEVLALLATGKASKEIAVLLACSVGSISKHRRSLCRKLNVHSTAELVCYAVMQASTTLRRVLLDQPTSGNTVGACDTKSTRKETMTNA